MAKPHVINVRFEGGPRHGRTIDLVITDRAPLPLMLAARQEGLGQEGGHSRDGLYELQSTQGGGTRYTWIDDLPLRA
ncbi:hypothetical protein [Streptomyces hoynatensis]|uniref:Uncharacterized protein n=1 Tax=Streptomyces hoynatensis TaxID=1141874 RepID=A0A3A9Z6R3_9ACTN|nr:hypothetical protein [Streptomyces hoynatensis]RKN42996.1 hypothetical protein D7294_10765 [Streptomyces hoynatensis]